MGLIDEHWCSNCKKSLNKRTDQYVEMNFNNWKGLHIQYRIFHKPSGKEKARVRTKIDAEQWFARLPKSRFADKDLKNYEVKILARKMKILKVNPEVVHDRVFICSDCYGKQMAAQVEVLRRKGNPIFHCSVVCWAAKECSTFEAPDGPPIPSLTTPISMFNAGPIEGLQEGNCKHIAVADDTLYCKRRHPGAVILAVEETIIQERRLRESPLFEIETVRKMRSVMSGIDKEGFLKIIPEDERKKKETELNTLLGALDMAFKNIEDQARQREEESSQFFLTLAGDGKKYAEVCQEKIMVQKPSELIAEEVTSAQ